MADKLTRAGGSRTPGQSGVINENVVSLGDIWQPGSVCRNDSAPVTDTGVVTSSCQSSEGRVDPALPPCLLKGATIRCRSNHGLS